MTSVNGSPIEVTTRYVTRVDGLGDAWSFVMAHVDLVGPDPKIEISPVWHEWDEDDSNGRHFAVVVEGMVSQETP